MALAHDFEYVKVSSEKEAVELFDKHKDKARIIAGGTDLVVKIKEGFDFPDLLVDIKGLNTLSKIELKGKVLCIGANVTFSDLIESELVKSKFHLLWEASATVASIGTRNRATLTGNICSAVPSLDSAPALLCYNAEVVVISKKGERAISIHEWFLGPKKTALKSNEIVKEIRLPVVADINSSCYKKLGRYAGEDLAQAGVGILITKKLEYRIAYCAVGPVPLRSVKVEKILNGKKLSDELLKKAKLEALKEISPISDIRAGKEYRQHMIQVMLERGLNEVFHQLK